MVSSRRATSFRWTLPFVQVLKWVEEPQRSADLTAEVGSVKRRLDTLRSFPSSMSFHRLGLNSAPAGILPMPAPLQMQTLLRLAQDCPYATPLLPFS